MISLYDNSGRGHGGETMISFEGAHFPPEIILTCVRWYVAYPLGFVASPGNSGRGPMRLHTAANAMDDTGSPPAVQMRVNTRHQELGAMCQRWYPDLQLAAGPQAA